MRKFKMIAACAAALLAVACGTAPAYADEVHPWCGTLYAVAAMAAAQPEDVEAMAEAIVDIPDESDDRKLAALMALSIGYRLRMDPAHTDTSINQGLTTLYTTCLKEHA